MLTEFENIIKPQFDYFEDTVFRYFVGPSFIVKIPYTGDCLQDDQETYLEKLGVLKIPRKELFNNLALCKAIFGWDRTAECDFLYEILDLKQSSKLLDVGCGWGAMLDMFTPRGVEIDGVDCSRPNILALRSKGFDVTLANITNFLSPKTYDAAFASMNTVRYITSPVSAIRHFQNVAEMLSKGGKYAVNLTIDGNNSKYFHSWSFLYGGKTFDVRWEKFDERPTHVLDRIQVTRRNFVVREEFQLQLNCTPETIRTIVEAISNNFSLIEQYDEKYNKIQPLRLTPGTFWLVFQTIK